MPVPKAMVIVGVFLPLILADRFATDLASSVSTNSTLKSKSTALALWEMIAPTGAKYTDVSQGELGTCYFLASIASIANMRPDIIKGMFLADMEEESTVEHPVWQVQFLLNGYPTTIAVDDQIPTSRNTRKPFFVSWNDGDQVWPVILEKAWAKIFGSFKGVEGGGIAEVFKAITQAPVEEINHQREQKSDYHSRKEALWQKMYQATQAHYPMGSATDDPQNPGGLAAGHAYAILGVVDNLAEVGFYVRGDTRGVHVYNPWASNQYKGILKGQSDKQGGFYMPFEEFLLSFRATTFAKTRDGYSLTHKTFAVSSGSQAQVQKTVSFRVNTKGPFSVQLEWPTRRFLPGCPESSPTAVMVVYKDTSPYSEMQFAEKSGVWMTNLRADVEGPGDFKVYIHTHLEKESWMQKVTLNVYAPEKVHMTEISQADPHALFLSAQNLCPEIQTQHGTFQTRNTFASNGLPYYENVDKYSQLRYIYFSPKRVLDLPGQDGSVKPVGSNEWHTIDNLDKAVGNPDIAFIGIGNLNEGSNKVSMGGCRALPSSQPFFTNPISSAPQSAQQPSTYFSGNFAQSDDCDAGVTKPYMMQASQPARYQSVDQCRALLRQFEDGSLNNVNAIKRGGSDPKFPAAMASIAEEGTDCGDAAHGIFKPCSYYNTWMSIKDMFGRVGGSSRMSDRPVRPIPVQPSLSTPYPSCFSATGSPNNCKIRNECDHSVKMSCPTASGSMRVTFPKFKYTYVNQNQPFCNANCGFDGFSNPFGH